MQVSSSSSHESLKVKNLSRLKPEGCIPKKDRSEGEATFFI